MHDLMVSQKKDIEKAVDYFESASFGDGTTDLITKMMPSVVTTETIENQSRKPIIQFKIYDPATKEGFKHGPIFSEGGFIIS
jgi:hypothetical protein